MPYKDKGGVQLKFMQLNMGHRQVAYDLLVAKLMNSSSEWVCCIQEPYKSNRGVSRLPPNYGAFWSEREMGESTRIRAMIILPRRLQAYQLSQYSNVNEVYVYIEEVNLCVVSIYCPMYMEMDKSIDNFGRVRKENKKMIACLDSNAYNYAWGSTSKAMESWRQKKRGELLYEFIDEYKFSVCNEVPHKPTFVRKEEDRTSGISYIDVIVCTIEIVEKLHEWMVHDTEFLTDHNPITFSYETERKEVGKEREEGGGIPWKRPTAKMKGIMCEELERNVKYKNKVRNVEEIDKFINIHVDEIKRVLHGVFKKKKDKGNKVYWWNKEVEIAHKSLKRARKRMRRYRHGSLKIEFNESRKNFRKVVNVAKAAAWKEYLASIKSPWEGLLKIVRATEVGKIQKRTLADLEGNYGKNMSHTLRMLGKQFYPAPAPLTEGQQQIEEEVKNELQNVEKGPKIMLHELKYALTQVSKTSASRADEVTNNVMCMLACKKYEKMYLELFNKCVELSYFPREWKRALITLIPKSGGGLDTVKAFRPISLTSVYAKLLERILLLRLQYYLKRSGKIVENQHTYRKGKSTQTALYEIFEFVQFAINKRGGGVCVVVFLDISGSFDRTWHAGILHKLLVYNVPKYMVAIISSL